MNMKLAEPLDSYYAAVNARAVERVLALFAENAVVKDEAEEHHGRDAIRAWMHGTMRKYGPIKVEPTAVAQKEGTTAVTVAVSGNFKGSPATLRYTFMLEHESIVRLEIA